MKANRDGPLRVFHTTKAALTDPKVPPELKAKARSLLRKATALMIQADVLTAAQEAAGKKRPKRQHQARPSMSSPDHIRRLMDQVERELRSIRSVAAREKRPEMLAKYRDLERSAIAEMGLLEKALQYELTRTDKRWPGT